MGNSLITKESIVPDLLASIDEIKLLKKEANHFLSWQLTDRQICDLELLLNGGFSPLKGFLSPIIMIIKYKVK